MYFLIAQGILPHYTFAMPIENRFTPTKKLFLAVLTLIALVIVGTIGLTILERMNPMDALYMTIITLSTVGFGEISPLHPEGRVFIIILIVVGVIGATFGASALGQVILEGELRRILGRRKMDKRIKKLSEHHIVAGFGRVGRQVAEEYVRQKVPFVVIENDNAAINTLDAAGYLYIAGQATEDDVLLGAGLDRARVLVSTLPSEADNVYLALTARHINASLHIIARADQPDGEKKLRRAGANTVVSPHVLGGTRMAMASLRPNVVDFMQMATLGDAGLGIEELSVPEDCRFGGKTLVESGIKAEYGVTVIGIKKPHQPIQINPDPNAVIEQGDILVLVGNSNRLQELAARLI
ncbi:MAG: potassium channel protein [Candidatus Zixiibacteriota bacterium]|nr:MAG: potassium channel protein [candidate division Zixibacteria bacterium]